MQNVALEFEHLRQCLVFAAGFDTLLYFFWCVQSIFNHGSLNYVLIIAHAIVKLLEEYSFPFVVLEFFEALLDKFSVSPFYEVVKNTDLCMLEK